jgi:hypothetical protein
MQILKLAPMDLPPPIPEPVSDGRVVCSAMRVFNLVIYAGLLMLCTVCLQLLAKSPRARCGRNKKKLKDDFKKEDGVTDSIRTCLSNFKVESYRIMLDDLTKPEFIKEDEEFLDLLQMPAASQDSEVEEEEEISRKG